VDGNQKWKLDTPRIHEHAVIRKFKHRNHKLPLAFLSQPCYNTLGDQTKPKIDGSPKKGPSNMDRKPLPYTESAENAGKPRGVRHGLMTGHMEKDVRRQRLDEIVAQYNPDSVSQNNFLVSITEWMLSWYDVLGCNAVDLTNEYRELANVAQSNMDEYLENNPTTDGVEPTGICYATMQATLRAHRERQAANEETWQHWNMRRGQLATEVRAFVQDFHSTDH
jgi:hypothetical protein